MRKFLVVSGLLLFQLLCATPKVVFTTMASEPYQGPDLLNEGYVVEITREAFKRVGYDFEVKYLPWARAMFEAENGTTDGLMGAYYTKKRTKIFSYSEPIGKVQLVFFAKKTTQVKYKTLKDLSPYTIGVVRGYAHNKDFDEATFIQKEETSTTELNLRKLLFDRVDIIADSRNVILFLIATKYPSFNNSLEVIHPPLQVNYLYNIFTKKVKGYKKKVKDFNRGLQMLKDDGTYDAILTKHGF